MEKTLSEEKREQTILGIANMLRSTSFSVEFKVKKKPAGIKVIIEVTHEQMATLAEQVINKSKRIEKQ